MREGGGGGGEGGEVSEGEGGLVVLEMGGDEGAVVEGWGRECGSGRGVVGGGGGMVVVGEGCEGFHCWEVGGGGGCEV